MFQWETTSSNSSASENETEYTIIQYAESVIFASDQYGPSSRISYTATNIIGRPSNYPAHGDFVDTYLLSTYGDWAREVPSFSPEFGMSNVSAWDNPPVHDFLVVRFEFAVYPKRIKIYETFNPGAVFRIWAFTVEGRWEMLWTNTNSETATTSRMRESRQFSPKIRNIGTKVRVLRLEFNTRDSTYLPGYDGILLVGTVFKIDDGWFKNSLKSTSVVPNQCDSVGASRNCLNITELPYEILYTIFSNLDVPSLRSVELVCKVFNCVARDSRLYIEINLRPYWMQVNSKMMRWLESRCTAIRKLDLSWCGMFGCVVEADVDRFLQTRGENITDLRLNDMPLDFTEDVFCIIVSCCTNLRELSLKNVVLSTNVKKIGIKNLIRLNLAGTSISTECLVDLLPNSPGLQHLNISCCLELDTQVIVATLARHNRELISLITWNTVGLRSAGLRTLHACTQLRELDIGWNIALESLDGALDEVVKNCPRLIKLFLAGVRGLQDADLAAIAEYCPDLEQLDLMGCISVTGPMVERVLNKCCKLRFIDVTYCGNIEVNFIQRWEANYQRLTITNYPEVQE